jgi:hypothetical protein
MRTTQILALFGCIILIAVGGITDAGENKLVNIDFPLPVDTKIVAPSDNVPKEIAAFSGAWEGKWTYAGTESALVVEEINFKGAKVILCRGKSQISTMPVRCERYKAIVTPENLQIRFSQSNNLFIFSMENDLNHIKGIKKTPVGDNEITMTKIK